MNCTESQALILEELFGELDQKGHQALQGHLKACPSCAAEFEQHQGTLELCSALPIHPAPGTARAAILQAAREAVTPPQAAEPAAKAAGWFPWPAWRVLAPAAGLAAILLAVVVTPFIVHEKETPGDAGRQPAPDMERVIADVSSPAPGTGETAAPVRKSTPAAAENTESAPAPAGNVEASPAASMAVAEIPPTMLPDREVQFEDTHFNQPSSAPLYDASRRDGLVTAGSAAETRQAIPVRRSKQLSRPGAPAESRFESATWSRREGRGDSRMPAELITEEGLLTQAEQMAQAGLLTQAAGAYTFFLMNFSGSSRAPEVWKEAIHCLFKAGKFKAARQNDDYLRQHLPSLSRRVSSFDELLRTFRNK